jgi:DNA-binding transcriptional LysR family regulator
VLSAFLKEHAGVSASLQVQRSEAIADWMVTQHFDIGFAMLPGDRPGLEVELFDPAPGICVLPRDHALTRKQTSDVRDLRGVPIIGHGPDSMVQRGLGELLAEAKVVPQVSVETPIAAIACEMVANGSGIAIVDPFTAHCYRQRGLLLRAFRPELPFRISIAQPEGRPRSRLVQSFLCSAMAARDALYMELGPEVRRRTETRRVSASGGRAARTAAPTPVAPAR